MNRQHSNRKPDFFVVLVLLVMLSFGLTVLIQMSSDVKSVAADGQPAKTGVVRS